MPERARVDGAKLGQALGVFIGHIGTGERQAALFTLARSFASMAHYTDVDSAFAYIEGFMSAFPTPAQLGAAYDERHSNG